MSAHPFGCVLVAIPCYNCAPQIPRVLQRLGQHPNDFHGVLVIDNRSTDGTLDAARAALEAWPSGSRTLRRNDDNYGLGGSHKVAFEHAMANGYDTVVILHGDDQGDFGDLAAFWRTPHAQGFDALLGARFAPDSRLQGYSGLRTFGNRAFNRLFALVTGCPVQDLGSGLNAYRRELLEDRFYWKFPDDLTFNYCMVMAHAELGHRIRFFPISWREEDQVSNVRLFSQARRVLGMLRRFAAGRREFLASELRARPRNAYPSTVIYEA